MSTQTKRIDGREIFRMLQGTKFKSEEDKARIAARDKLVLAIDEGREPLSVLSSMRRTIFGEAVSILARMKADARYFDEMTSATGIRPPDVTLAILREKLQLAPPSALTEAANRVADEILEDAFREAETITGKL